MTTMIPILTIMMTIPITVIRWKRRYTARRALLTISSCRPCRGLSPSNHCTLHTSCTIYIVLCISPSNHCTLLVSVVAQVALRIFYLCTSQCTMHKQHSAHLSAQMHKCTNAQCAQCPPSWHCRSPHSVGAKHSSTNWSIRISQRSVLITRHLSSYLSMIYDPLWFVIYLYLIIYGHGQISQW